VGDRIKARWPIDNEPYNVIIEKVEGPGDEGHMWCMVVDVNKEGWRIDCEGDGETYWLKDATYCDGVSEEEHLGEKKKKKNKLNPLLMAQLRHHTPKWKTRARDKDYTVEKIVTMCRALHGYPCKSKAAVNVLWHNDDTGRDKWYPGMGVDLEDGHWDVGYDDGSRLQVDSNRVKVMESGVINGRPYYCIQELAKGADSDSDSDSDGDSDSDSDGDSDDSAELALQLEMAKGRGDSDAVAKLSDDSAKLALRRAMAKGRGDSDGDSDDSAELALHRALLKA